MQIISTLFGVFLGIVKFRSKFVSKMHAENRCFGAFFKRSLKPNAQKVVKAMNLIFSINSSSIKSQLAYRV